MEKYRCRKTIQGRYVEGESYWGYSGEHVEVYFINESGLRESIVNIPQGVFTENKFKEHFYTVDEVREMEIDKILDS